MAAFLEAGTRSIQGPVDAGLADRDRNVSNRSSTLGHCIARDCCAVGAFAGLGEVGAEPVKMRMLASAEEL